MKRITLILILLSLSIISSAQTDLIPLSVGNQWKYVGQKTIKGETQPFSDTIVSKVEKGFKFLDTEWLKYTEIDTKFYYCLYKGDIYETFLEEETSGRLSEPTLIFKSPKGVKKYPTLISANTNTLEKINRFLIQE